MKYQKYFLSRSASLTIFKQLLKADVIIETPRYLEPRRFNNVRFLKLKFIVYVQAIIQTEDSPTVRITDQVS